ncbi:hypothetical protein Slin15195_G112380 [Septoria linicola]|uniref:Uncharacterized protein n=1 Tax=Septoria linicola TaxID=215465 RepID=A0A9Q9AYU2_9PEZI|nr:hypothetical protein Slin15195_G112380 [Septoria linicola]
MQFTTIVASALAVAFAAASPHNAPPTYGESNSTAPTYPITNGTTPSGPASPSGTGAVPGTSATFEPHTGAASKVFGSSAAMGLVLVGGVALAL